MPHTESFVYNVYGKILLALRKSLIFPGPLGNLLTP